MLRYRFDISQNLLVPIAAEFTTNAQGKFLIFFSTFANDGYSSVKTDSDFRVSAWDIMATMSPSGLLKSLVLVVYLVTAGLHGLVLGRVWSIVTAFEILISRHLYDIIFDRFHFFAGTIGLKTSIRSYITKCRSSEKKINRITELPQQPDIYGYAFIQIWRQI